MMRKTIHWIGISTLAVVFFLGACSPQAAGQQPGAAAAPSATVANSSGTSAQPSATTPASQSGSPAAASTQNNGTTEQAGGTAAQSTATASIPNSGGAASATGTASPSGAAAQATTAPAANCTSPAALTPAMTEGPYFKAGSPEQSNLVQPGMSGTKLTLTGYVLDTSCQPIAHALLDFWQADAQGQYDNSGYTLRGHVFSDANGRYQVETVIPGLYPGRTEHIHVKVQPPNGAVLTTQLFFPGVAQNQSDQIFDQRLLLNLQDGPDGKLATYTFIVNK